MEGEIICAESSALSRSIIADQISIGILQDILKAELPDLHDAFEKAMGTALSLARDLIDVVDLMLLPLLEQHESIITKRETGTLSIQYKLGAERQKDEEQRAEADESVITKESKL
jgi:hypothetical protein